MLGLILRDLSIQRKKLWLVAAYCVLGPLLMRILGPAAVALVMAGVVYMIVINAFEYDDKYGAEAVMVSLPVRREALVAARYVQIPLFSALTVLLFLLSALLFAGPYPMRWSLPAEIFLGISVFGGVYIPLVYRRGFSRIRVYNFVLMMVFCFTPFIVITWETRMPLWFQRLVTGADMAMAGAMTLTGLLILYISCLISVRIYRKRQF